MPTTLAQDYTFTALCIRVTHACMAGRLDVFTASYTLSTLYEHGHTHVWLDTSLLTQGHTSSSSAVGVNIYTKVYGSALSIYLQGYTLTAGYIYIYIYIYMDSHVYG